MVLPNVTRSACGTAFAVALIAGAAAQTASFSERLTQGQQLRNHDRFADARTVFRALLQDLRKDGSNHRFEALVLDNLAQDEQDTGDYAAAETAFNHGLAAAHAEKADDPIVTGLQTHLAELYIAESRSDEAEPLLRRTVASLRSATPRDPVALAIANEDLAVVCIMRHKFVEPEGLLREARTLIESQGGPSDPRLIASLLTYAGLLTAQHRYDDAIEPAERAWSLVKGSTMLIPKPYLASASSVLGAVYYHTGRLADAESYARKSVELAEESLGPQHPRLGLYLANYAVILKQAGRKNEAKAIQKRADQIFEANPSSGSGGYTVNAAALR
jgi:tetratricopeptide (TPR) repeat protein